MEDLPTARVAGCTLLEPEDGPRACGNFHVSLRSDHEFRMLLRVLGPGLAREYDVGWIPKDESFVLVDEQHRSTGMVVRQQGRGRLNVEVCSDAPTGLRGLLPDSVRD